MSTQTQPRLHQTPPLLHQTPQYPVTIVLHFLRLVVHGLASQRCCQGKVCQMELIVSSLVARCPLCTPVQGVTGMSPHHLGATAQLSPLVKESWSVFLSWRNLGRQLMEHSVYFPVMVTQSWRLTVGKGSGIKMTVKLLAHEDDCFYFY